MEREGALMSDGSRLGTRRTSNDLQPLELRSSRAAALRLPGGCIDESKCPGCPDGNAEEGRVARLDLGFQTRLGSRLPDSCPVEWQRKSLRVGMEGP